MKVKVLSAKEDADDLGELLRDPNREKIYKDQTRLKPPPRVAKRKAEPASGKKESPHAVERHQVYPPDPAGSI